MPHPDPVLADDVESMRLLILPTSEQTFEVRWQRNNYWSSEVIDAGNAPAVSIEQLAQTIWDLVFSWAPTQAANSRQIDSEARGYTR